MSFIDEHRQAFGVEPICRVLIGHGLKIAPSTYYAAKTRPALCLSPGPDDTIEVIDDGHISHTLNPHLANAMTDPLPTLARPEAYAQLMTLPTVRTTAPLEPRMRPPG